MTRSAVGIVGYLKKDDRAIQSMETPTTTFFALFLAFLVLLLTITTGHGNPMPQSLDDYGDWDESAAAAAREGRDDEADASSGEDPLGDLFGDILKGAGALIQGGVEFLQDISDGNKNVSETVGDALKVGSDAAQEATRIGIKAVGAAPEILERKVKFAHGLGKTLQESTGTVQQGLDEASTQLRVASAFARTYGEFAAENLVKFMDTFHKRLKCNTDCEELEKGSPERDQCETENCIEMPKNEEEIEEEYDYSYGYEDESVNEIIQVSPRTSEETS